MRRELDHPATLFHGKSGATSLALLATALLVTAGCGGSEGSDGGTVAETLATPVVVAVATPEDTPTSTAPTVPENVTYETAESAFAEKRYAEAAEMFAVYTTRRPDNPWGQYMLGLSAWKAGDLAVAERGLEAALALDSTHVKSLLNLGRVLLDAGRPEDALLKVERALALDPRLPDAHRVMGRVHSELRQPEEAVADYRRAIVLDDRDAWAMNNMGLVLIRQGRFEEALGPLARAVELDSGVAVFHNNLGVALERTGHYLAAAEAFRKVLAIDSTYGKASVSLARVEGRVEDPTLVPVDPTAIAASFVAEVQGWREPPVTEVRLEEVMPADSTKPDEPVVAQPE